MNALNRYKNEIECNIESYYQMDLAALNRRRETELKNISEMLDIVNCIIREVTCDIEYSNYNKRRLKFIEQCKSGNDYYGIKYINYFKSIITLPENYHYLGSPNMYKLKCIIIPKILIDKNILKVNQTNDSVNIYSLELKYKGEDIAIEDLSKIKLKEALEDA